MKRRDRHYERNTYGDAEREEEKDFEREASIQSDRALNKKE